MLAFALLAASSCSGGGGSGALPPPVPHVSSSPTPIPIPTGATGYYVAAVVPPNGVPVFISDPIYLRFSQTPDVTFDQHGNPQGSTVDAIGVTPLTGAVPTPLAVRYIYDPTNPKLGPNVLGVKFFAVGGASYHVTIASSAKSASGTPYSGLSSFVVTLPTTPPLPAPVQPLDGSPLFWGLVPQTAPTTSPSQVKSWLTALHPRVVRIGVDSGTVEPTKGNFDFSTLDSRLANAGVPAIVLIVQYNAPGWANGTGGPGPGGSGYIFCQPQDFADFVTAVVDHVLKQAKAGAYPVPAAFELGNEPDTPSFWNAAPGCPYPFTTLSDPSPYLPYLRAAYAEAKPVATNDGYPNVPLLNAGVATNAGDEAYFDGIVDALRASSQAFLDAYAVHIYAWADPNPNAIPTRSWEAFKVLIDDGAYAAGSGESKNFFVTEGGFQTSPYCPDGVDPQTQAYFLVEDFNRMAQLSIPSVVAFTYFDLQDTHPFQAPLPGSDPCFDTDGIGLVSAGGQVRPAFAAFANL